MRPCNFLYCEVAIKLPIFSFLATSSLLPCANNTVLFGAITKRRGQSSREGESKRKEGAVRKPRLNVRTESGDKGCKKSDNLTCASGDSRADKRRGVRSTKWKLEGGLS